MFCFLVNLVIKYCLICPAFASLTMSIRHGLKEEGKEEACHCGKAKEETIHFVFFLQEGTINQMTDNRSLHVMALTTLTKPYSIIAVFNPQMRFSA